MENIKHNLSKFTVYKNSNYSIMDNYMLRDINLSNKSLGLLCRIFSLPPNWDLSVRGLCNICKDKRTSIESQLSELIELGYMSKEKIRNTKGQFIGYNYSVYEQPIPKAEKPKAENLKSENQQQLNKDVIKHNIIYKNNINKEINKYSEQEFSKEETEKLSDDNSQTKFDTEINFSIDDAILYKNIPVLYKEDTDELLEYCDDYGITEYIPDNNTEQYNTTEYKYDKQTPKKSKTAKPKFSDRGADFKKVTKPRSKSVSINNLDDSLECVKIAKLYNSLSEMFPVQKIKFFSETLASQINGMIEQYGYDRYYNAVKLLLKDASFKTSRFNYPYKAHHILVDNTDRIEKFIDVDEDKLIHMEKFEEDFSNFKTEYDKIMRQTYPTKTELAEAKAMYAELSEEERQLAKKMIVHVMYHREMKMKEYLKLQIYKYDKAERTKILGCVSSQYDYRPLY